MQDAHWDSVLGKDDPALMGRIEKDIADAVTQQQESDAFYGNLEQTYNREQAIEAAKADLNFLAPLAIPIVFKFLFPPMFLLIWQLLQGAVAKVRDFTQLVLGIPRGFGKTMLIKLFALFCILFTGRKFILITAATSALAENIIADVIDMLEETNIKRLFGDWKLHVEIDRQELKKFTYRGRPLMLAAIGAGGSLRGLNIKNERPDVMIFEDIQTRECADSKVESDKLERWMIGTAMKAKSPFGCLFIFVGNMYPTPNCILRKLKDNPNWIKFICGGILSDMTSLWKNFNLSNNFLQNLIMMLAWDILKSSLQKFSMIQTQESTLVLILQKWRHGDLLPKINLKDHLYLLILLETKDATMLQSDFLKYMMLFPHYEKLMKEITLQEKQLNEHSSYACVMVVLLLELNRTLIKLHLLTGSTLSFNNMELEALKLLRYIQECTPKTVEFLKLCVKLTQENFLYIQRFAVKSSFRHLIGIH